MKFDFKFDGDKKLSSKTRIISTLGAFWQRIYKTVFFVFLLVSIGLGAYVWQKSLSGGGWSAEKKQEYLNSQSRGVIFKEGDFKKVIADVEFRTQSDMGEWQEFRDIFRAY